MKTYPNIRLFDLEHLTEIIVQRGIKPFRAKQLYQWLWKKSAVTFDEMTDLPKEVRSFLVSNYCIDNVKIKTLQKSNDGTLKFAFQLFDGNYAEGVLIPQSNRMTACISSQVGCSLSCKFCATGSLERMRNLNFDEIYDQVVLINRAAASEYGRSLSNIVFMGMGEPLLNYSQVQKGIEKITGVDGLGMSPKRITLSTVGIAKMIKKLADDNPKVNLALSLHSAIEEKRAEIMPITGSNTLSDIREAVGYFYEKTGIRITYEYTLLKGFNDQLDDALALAEFCKITPCKINLIEYNPVESSSYKKSTREQTHIFKDFLESKNLVVNIRRSRGKDIDAACGQLANKSIIESKASEKFFFD